MYKPLRLNGVHFGTLVVVLSLHLGICADAADTGRTVLSGHVPQAVAGLAPIGRVATEKTISLAIGLPLRNQAELDQLLEQLQDPRSSKYHKYLSCAEFTARFGPTEQEYAAVAQFARQHGLTVARTYSNRLVIDVEGSSANMEQAFQVALRTYKHPNEPREFFAPDAEPSVPAGLSVADMWGLSDYARPRPMLRQLAETKAAPLNYNGTGPGGSYRGADFRNAYASGATLLRGNGQIAALAEFDGYYTNDIASYLSGCGYSNVLLQNVIVDGVSGKPGFSGLHDAVVEVSMDIEVLIAMAPGLSKVMVYEGNNPYDVFNRFVTDNQAKQMSCSWLWNVGPSYNWGQWWNPKTLDAAFQQMAAQGQSFFQASGDDDAYTGSQAISSSAGPVPVDSAYVTSVGGTSLTMSGSGGAWSSETVWNWGSNTGSAGGVSRNYSIPSWQAPVSMSANGGSTTYRNFPDVAMTADAVYVVYSNGLTTVVGGTSCAAPLWAGYTAMVNQQAATAGRAPAGFLNPALYALGTGTNYSACFHDTTAGNNIGSGTPGLYNAEAGYDLCTGWGTPNGVNLVNALAPAACILASPASQTATNGNNVSLSVTPGGQPPFDYRWRFNGTNLPAGGNVSGNTGPVLTISSVASANAGNYSVVLTNNYGASTSSVAVLTVVAPPFFAAHPTNQSVLAGGAAVFSATVSGASPLTYRWQKGGTNLVNGGNISGATSNVLTLSSVTATNAGSYVLVATNIYGAATSSVASLTVLLPPGFTGPLAPQTVQCGSNAAFSATATGTSPLSYQWLVDDGVALSSATNSTLLLTNVHLPNHTVAVIASNPYGSATNATTLTVQDTLSPVITLVGASPLYVELGGLFVDPGAAASDLCVGAVVPVASGFVNTNAVSTNTITYTANDGNGNTSTATRTVIVRDTVPPAILWSFTNLTLALGPNCSVALPDLTGTNYLTATDLSGSVTVSQTPSSGTLLALGTNPVVLTATDPSGNAAHSTNWANVQDQTPPVLGSQPSSQTNVIGSSVSFSVTATACTPITFQWLFNKNALSAQTNNALNLSNIDVSSAGAYFAVASAGGGASTSAVAVLTVDLLTPSLTVNSTESPSGFLDNLQFAANVGPANATGSVQFLTNGVLFDSEPLAGGTAVSATNNFLPRGTNIITALYSGDSTSLPATNSFDQVVTNHPPVAAEFIAERTAGSVLLIPVSSLATNWYDVDGDIPLLVDIGISTNGVAITNGAGTLVYSNTNDMDDQFVCTISDGWGGTNYQTVSILMVSPPPPPTPGTISVSSAPDDTILLQLAGSAGATCVLEATAVLVSPDGWVPLATNILGTNGIWQFSDNVTNGPQRFYRLRFPLSP